MDLASLMRTIGRGAARVPRVIGNALYDTQPILEEDTLGLPLLDPGDEAIAEGGVDMFGPGMDAPLTSRTQQYRIVGEKKAMKPGVKRFLKTLPGALEAGAVAASTPNVAAGGGTDLMRALAIGMGYPRQRAREEEELRAAREARKQAARKTEADIEQSRAQAENYRAEAAARGRPTGPGRQAVIPFTALGYIYDPNTKEWIKAPGQTEPAPPTVDKVKAEVMKKLMDPSTPTEQIPILRELAGIATPRGRAGTPTISEQAAERMKVADELGLRGDARTTYIATGRLPAERGGGGPGTAGPSAAQSRAIEYTKQKEIKDAEEAFSAGEINADELRRRKQRAQDAYEAQILAVGGNVTEPFVYPSAEAQPQPSPGGPASPPAPPKPQAYTGPPATEADVRDYAKAAGVGYEEAVQAFNQRGIPIQAAPALPTAAPSPAVQPKPPMTEEEAMEQAIRFAGGPPWDVRADWSKFSEEAKNKVIAYLKKKRDVEAATRSREIRY